MWEFHHKAILYVIMAYKIYAYDPLRVSDFSPFSLDDFFLDLFHKTVQKFLNIGLITKKEKNTFSSVDFLS